MCRTDVQSTNRDTLVEMIHYRDDEIDILREQIRHLKVQLYGRKSEKGVPLVGQADLFDAEDTDAEKPGEKLDEMLIPAHKRKKRSRGLPDHLERKVEFITPVKEERFCCGQEMPQISCDETEKLVYKRAELYVHVLMRPKFACNICEGTETDGSTVKQSPAPPQIIPKSYASSSLLSQIITARFVDALPYYRQEKQFERLGFNLSRVTMSSWAIKVADKCLPLINLIRQFAKSGDQLGIDETTFQVMNEVGRSNKTKSYMWVIRGGPPSSPVILFHYHPNRTQDVARELLKDYKGYVQTDGYAAYKYLDKDPNTVHLVCWAHVLRKFVAVVKARRPKKKKNGGKRPHADVIIELIRQLYSVEKFANTSDLDGDARQALRQEKSVPALAQIKEKLDNLNGKVPPKSLLGKAIKYTLDNWERLGIYLQEPYLRPDNNLVENAIRPFVLGRKNWMLAGDPAGARAGATFYTLAETAKANGWSPQAYFSFLFSRLAVAETTEDFINLMPTNSPDATKV